MVAFCCTLIVGVVVLFSGLTKVIDSGKFVRHVFQYRLIPTSLLFFASMLFISIEAGLGMALMLHMWPQWLVPLSILLFIGFAALTIWGTRSGRIEDCGCYGGLLAVSPKQSVMLDGIYSLILLLVFLFPVRGYETGIWKIVLSAIVMLLALGVSLKSVHEPLVEFSRLKKGRLWKATWLTDKRDDMSAGTHFVVFLDRECIFCKRWVPFLNVINVEPELPKVSGVMSLSTQSLKEFKKEHMIRFPIARMDRFLAATMTSAFPTAVLIENGRIVEKWVGEMPEKYLESVKQFFKSIGTGREKESVFSG